MESTDFDSGTRIRGMMVEDSRLVQELQQNMSKFHTLMEEVRSKVEQLEATTAVHTKNCVCMGKEIQQHESPTSDVVETNKHSPTLEAHTEHAEFVPIDSKIKELDSRIDALQNDLISLKSSIKEMKAVKQKWRKSQKQKIPNGAGTTRSNIVTTTMIPSTSSSVATISSSLMTASKLVLNQQQHSHERKQQLVSTSPATTTVRPPPPRLVRAPGSSSTSSLTLIPRTPTSSVSTTNNSNNMSLLKSSLIAGQQQQQQKPPAMPSTSTATPFAFNDDDEDDENMSDEYEGEEDIGPVGGGSNDNRGRVVKEEPDEDADHDQDETFMQIQPEIILYDDYDDAEGGEPPNHYSHNQGGQQDGEIGGDAEELEDSLNFDLGFGVTDMNEEDEGPVVEIEFRDKLGNIVQCLSYQLSGRIRCPICPITCMSRRNIIRHYNNKHADPKFYECSICGAILNRKDSLTVHLRNQHNVIEQGGKYVLAPPIPTAAAPPDESQPTATTSSNASSSEGPASTAKSSSNASGVQYSCNSCGKSFSRVEALTRHNCDISSPSNGVVPRMARTSPAPKKLHTIKQETHHHPQQQSLLNPVIAKKCPLCPKTFTVRNSLVRHLKAHTQNNQCVACGKCYSRRDKLRAHQRKHHGQVLDDQFIDQNLNMNQPYDDEVLLGDGATRGEDGFTLELEGVDMSMMVEEEEQVMNIGDGYDGYDGVSTGIWEYS